MPALDPLKSQLHPQSPADSIAVTPAPAQPATTDKLPTVSAPVTITLSSLAQQLSDAAARAAERDASLTRNQLGDKARQIIDTLIGQSYDLNKAKHDAEIPDTTDPMHLERARQATKFLNGEGGNPFHGMDRQQLVLIAYDESGTFTINERRAAWTEEKRQDQEWRVRICAEMTEEYNRTGKVVDSLIKIREYYKSLPPILEAQLPDGYQAQLNARIAAGGGGTEPEEIFHIVNEWDRQLQTKV